MSTTNTVTTEIRIVGAEASAQRLGAVGQSAERSAHQVDSLAASMQRAGSATKAMSAVAMQAAATASGGKMFSPKQLDRMWSSGGGTQTKTKAPKQGGAGDAGKGFANIAQGASMLSSAMAPLGGQAFSFAAGMAASAATTAGINALSAAITGVTNTLKGAIKGSVAYTSELEVMKIGIGAVFQTSGRAPSFAKGFELAGDSFARLNRLAMESPATTKDLLGIFQGLVGPLGNAGMSLKEIELLAQSASTASMSLGVDMQQATRDLSLMARGQAGAHAKVFSMLSNTGVLTRVMGELGIKGAEAGKDISKAFNKLDPAKRAQVIQKSIMSFQDASAAMGQSWKGVTSTTEDILAEAGRAFITPIMNGAKGALEKINTVWLANQKSIQGVFSALGTAVVTAVSPIFKRFAHMIGIFDYWAQGAGAHNLTNSIMRFGQAAGKMVEATVVRLDDAFNAMRAKFTELKPVILELVAAIKAFVMPKMTKQNVGGTLAVMAGGMLAGKGLGMVSKGAGIAGGLAGVVGGGAAAVSAGGGMAAVGAALTAMAPIVLAVVAVVGVLGLAFVAVKQNLMSFAEVAGRLIWPAIQALVIAGMAWWRAFQPVLQLLGGVILVTLLGVITVLTAAVRVLAAAFTFVMECIESLTAQLQPALTNGINDAISEFRHMATILGEVRDGAAVAGRAIAALFTGPAMARLKPEENEIDRETRIPGLILSRDTTGSASKPKEQPKTTKAVVDARGAQITIKQEFKTKTDPDRIVRAMMFDLQNQAESRIASAFGGALTR